MTEDQLCALDLLGCVRWKALPADEGARIIEEMSLKAVLAGLDAENSYTVTCNAHPGEGGGWRIKSLRYSYIDRKAGIIAMGRSDITEVAKGLEERKRLLELTRRDRLTPMAMSSGTGCSAALEGRCPPISAPTPSWGDLAATSSSR